MEAQQLHAGWCFAKRVLMLMLTSQPVAFGQIPHGLAMNQKSKSRRFNRLEVGMDFAERLLESVAEIGLSKLRWEAGTSKGELCFTPQQIAIIQAIYKSRLLPLLRAGEACKNVVPRTLGKRMKAIADWDAAKAAAEAAFSLDKPAK
jgi:hypothetical protein